MGFEPRLQETKNTREIEYLSWQPLVDELRTFEVTKVGRNT
jgi:hypothetical protein